ncbi:MAG: bifunctional DNA-formamidopyrimidine glycosylase/DNA-(apurinic or apyrimidinic site) lyase [Anaerolineae bacterium]|nr:bifunctional DNA-formamidopyrimidine glycosylase/DNA-(apurinic or apyrimidinic site) lyase [Anaerolineae bacterium]MCB0198441.1 bifunctional DNA-formamidopyrimidine glycosylase/DNA-(apurinic or apyrimidinic site) lyase [Anaerolineae bacterium]MCB0204105.1 bifunctional DNA-formamidopyrimidine glycosylase/DNA-(apurinic or apyrimidinic site) lyase [Anaerolineae bacterium]
MPELPEVENTVRDLKPLLVGRRFEGVDIRWPRLLSGMPPEEFTERLLGRQIVNADRRGKYLLFALDDGQTLMVHLRMTGQLHVTAPEEPAGVHDHLVFALSDGAELRYQDPRKFGRFLLTRTPQAALEKLGPEPLSESFTPVELFARIQGRRAAIKGLLLNQSVVAGLGNIYADEALFQAGIHPLSPGYALTLADCNRLHSAIRQTLATAIREGGSTLGRSSITNYRRPAGMTGRYQDRHQVYGRAGEPCRVCGATIQRVRIAQRSTHFCPHCQAGAEAINRD